jgi:uncharacterized membrane protein (Fun14 family)
MENATLDTQKLSQTLQEVLKEYGFDMGYGFLVGLTVGYALKKFFKLTLFVVGVFFLVIIGLQQAGIITVQWDAIGQWLTESQNNFQNFVQGLTKSLPFSASFAVGFAVGFRMG